MFACETKTNHKQKQYFLSFSDRINYTSFFPPGDDVQAKIQQTAVFLRKSMISKCEGAVKFIFSEKTTKLEEIFLSVSMLLIIVKTKKCFWPPQKTSTLADQLQRTGLLKVS